jgi:hypothetical protein
MIVYFIIGLILHLLAFFYRAYIDPVFNAKLKKSIPISILAFIIQGVVVTAGWLPIIVYSLIVGENRVPI